MKTIFCDHLGPGDEPGCDGGVDVAAGDVTYGLGHRGHGDSETQGDPDILGLGDRDITHDVYNEASDPII